MAHILTSNSTTPIIPDMTLPVTKRILQYLEMNDESMVITQPHIIFELSKRRCALTNKSPIYLLIVKENLEVPLVDTFQTRFVREVVPYRQNHPFCESNRKVSKIDRYIHRFLVFFERHLG